MLSPVYAEAGRWIVSHYIAVTKVLSDEGRTR
jgi:hypothetical protein